MKTKKINKNKILALCFVLSILVTSIVTYKFAQAAFSGNLEDLPFYVGAPEPYDYLIDTNSTHYFGFNGTTGLVDVVSNELVDTLQSIVKSDISLQFGSGTFLLSDTWNFTSLNNVDVKGNGASILKQDDDINKTSFSVISCTNIRFYNLEIDGNYANNGVDESVFSVGSSEDFVLEECHIHDGGGDAIEISDSRGLIINNIFEDNSEHDIHNNGNGAYSDNQLTISNNRMIGNGGASIFLWHSKNIILENNFIEAASSSAIHLYQSSGSQNCSNILISSNTIQHNTGYGVRVQSDAYGLKIIGNHIINQTLTGIYFQANDISETVISSNSIYDSGSNGLSITADSEFTDITIIGNSIENSGNHGIELSSANYTLITGNTISHSQNHGIRVRSSYYGVISDNHIINSGLATTNTYSGILFTFNSSYNLIENNLIQSYETNVMKYGIYEDNAFSDYNIYVGDVCRGAGTSNFNLQGVNGLYDACVDGDAWLP